MKVLVIEDDRDVRTSLIKTLQEEAILVDSAEDGEEGMYRAAEWKYDVIILDVMLPKLDGWEILARLRERNDLTPVLMLTALDALDDRIKGLNQGADDYLAKPYSEGELLARLRALHRRATGQAKDTINLGSVELKTAQQTVTLSGRQVQLTASQYRIVAYLAERAGTVISRTELGEAITDEDDETFSRVIDVQVYHIRRKLGKDFVQSRRGLGYVIPLG